MDDIYALQPMPRERYGLLIDGPIDQYARYVALLRQWPTLIEWIRQDFDALRTLEELGRAASVHQQAARDPDLLVHRGENLAKSLLVVDRDLVQRRFSAPERDVIEAYLKFGTRPAAPGNRATLAARIAVHTSCRRAAFAASRSAGPPGVAIVPGRGTGHAAYLVVSRRARQPSRK